jgi:hypothetical protein
MMGRAVLVAIAIVGSLALAGCGGEELTKEQYVEQAAASLGSVDSALAELQDASAATLVSEVDRAETALLAAAAALQEIDAPEELREGHRLLVEGIRELAGELLSVLTAPVGDVADTVERIESLPALEKLARARERFAQEDVTLELGKPPPQPGL